MTRVFKSKKRVSPSGIAGRMTGNGSTYYDGFRIKRSPSDETLVKEYKGTVFACANRNANGVTNNPLRLYLRTSPGEDRTILRDGIEKKAISSQKINYLTSLPNLSKTLNSMINVEEVVSHPILTLLERANDSPHINGVRLSELTELYLDITGKAYWLVQVNVFNVPTNIWILPSHWMEVVKDSGTKNIVDRYVFTSPGNKSTVYNEADIIPFRKPSLTNPYINGLSSLGASFDSNEVNTKLLSHENGLLENEARPDAILAPGKDGAFGADEAERYERQWKLKFGKGRSGGIWVPEDEINYIPVTIPPRDLARLEIHKWSKNAIANAHDVPFALISDASHNRQQLEAAQVQHAEHAIKPRCSYRACVLNSLLLPLFDPSGRLFIAYDDPVPENRTEKLQENVQFVMNGIKTPNESRKDYGLPPLPGGDELRAINVSPELMRDNEREAGTAEK